MVGSGIASASRKPAGSRGSWLRQKRAGYLSPRPSCAHNIYTVNQARIERVQPKQRKMPSGQGNASRLVQVPVNKPGRLGGILPCPDSEWICARPPCPRRHVHSKQVAQADWVARLLCLL